MAENMKVKLPFNTPNKPKVTGADRTPPNEYPVVASLPSAPHDGKEPPNC